jgi:hypothetical protein
LEPSRASCSANRELPCPKKKHLMYFHRGTAGGLLAHIAESGVVSKRGVSHYRRARSPIYVRQLREVGCYAASTSDT